MALFLSRRGYSVKYLQDITNWHHQKLLNITKLADILRTIKLKHEKIVIMPDFDTDGISAGTVGFAGLAELGFNVGLYRPNPKAGYGINISDIKKVMRQFPDVKYIISCDVGITCYDAFFYAYSHGIKVLITDHHEEEIEKKKPFPTFSDHEKLSILPGVKTSYNQKTGLYVHTGLKKIYCEVIVNPCQLAETYKLRDICGAFVFWQVLNEYTNKYENDFMHEQIHRLRLFAGIGTVGDMMRVIRENRKLLQDTVSLLQFIYNDGDDSIVNLIPGCPVYQRAFRGLFLLLKELESRKQLYGTKSLDEKFIGWTIAPIYNSAKRLGVSMELVFGLFFGDHDFQVKAAKKMIDNNNDRKTKVKDFTKILDDEIDDGKQKYAPYIMFSDAPGGILGLLANQYLQKNKVPSFVINRENLAGSGRSLAYFPVIKALKDTEFTVKGHNLAFGISFTDLDQVDRFYQYLQEYVVPLIDKDKKHHKDDCDLTLAAEDNDGNYDSLININECFEFHQETLNLKPFGAGFAEPKIRILFKPGYATSIITMGKEKQHLKVVLANGLQLIAWNSAQYYDALVNEDVSTFVGDFSFNDFRGHRSLQMIGDFKIVEDNVKEDVA